MSEPRMSVVLVTDDYDSVSPVLDRLVRQTAREHLEVVVVTPSPEQIPTAAANLQGFAAVQVLEHGPPLDLGDGRAAGVRAASAALVFIGETHSYPHPQMAQTLIDAHAGPWAAVVPGFGIANPDGVLSWAGFLSDYGPWLEGLPAEEITYAPNYNASYRRSVLLELGDELGTALSHGDGMLRGLRRRQHRIYFEPAARIDHVNLSRPGAFVAERYAAGRLIAAERAHRWPWGRRLIYACGAPLLPAVYLSRARVGARMARRKAPAGTLATMVAGTVVKAAGEMAGYVLGSGAGAAERMLEYELHKVSYVSSNHG